MSSYPLSTQIRNKLARSLLGLRRSFLVNFWGMHIGENVRISSSAKLDKTNPRGIHIGSDTAVSFDVAILSHDFINARHLDTRIGQRCMIGARSIIYPGITIGDECIVGAASVVMSDVPPHSVVSGNPARIVERGIRTGRWGSRYIDGQRRQKLAASANILPPLDAGSEIHHDIASIIQTEIPRVAPEDYDKPFNEIGLDSFHLISLRAGLETRIGMQIPDEAWSSIESISDIIALAASPSSEIWTKECGQARADVLVATPLDQPAIRLGGATEQRFYNLNMPQMAMEGMSESWLLKEMGDIHWSILTRGLGQDSASIIDGEGNRLYATFTRISYSSTTALKCYKENSAFNMKAEMERFGNGIFLSETKLASDCGDISINIMSSFSKRSEEGSNKKLLKGQPAIPPGCPIKAMGAQPPEMDEYRDKRSTEYNGVIFETKYEIVPFHDINGVGLLYFAAYPIINDICCTRYLGASFSDSYSTRERKIYYFSNCEPNETLVFRIHAWDDQGDDLRIVTSLSRQSDDKRMCLIESIKSRV